MNITSTEALAVCEAISTELASLLKGAANAIAEGRYGAAHYLMTRANTHVGNLRTAAQRGLAAAEMEPAHAA
jgi:hypothetical protein